MKRDRNQDLERLALMVFGRMRRDDIEYGGWSLDGKRPFGFSGRSAIAHDILDGIGYPLDEDDTWSEDAREYAHSLYGDVMDFIKAEWRKRPESQRSSAGRGEPNDA